MYVVHFNRDLNQALVHSTECPHYRRRTGDRTARSYWSQEFDTRTEALKFAHETGMGRSDNAGRCCARFVA